MATTRFTNIYENERNNSLKFEAAASIVNPKLTPQTAVQNRSGGVESKWHKCLFLCVLSF